MNDLLKGKFTKFENPTGNYNAKQLGTLKTVFAGLSFRFQDKNPYKKPCFIFFNPANEAETLLVVLSTKLAQLYRAGGITKKQLPSLMVTEMDLFNPTTNELVAKGVLRLQMPTSGVMKMDDIVAEDYVDAIAGF